MKLVFFPVLRVSTNSIKIEVAVEDPKNIFIYIHYLFSGIGYISSPNYPFDYSIISDNVRF